MTKDRVLTGFAPQNCAARHFSKVCEAASPDGFTLKDLRDTFESQLLTAGVSLGYVSRQLGHADLATTARHYARYLDEDYRQPLAVEPGEVPADLLAKLIEVTPHATPFAAFEDVDGV